MSNSSKPFLAKKQGHKLRLGLNQDRGTLKQTLQSISSEVANETEKRLGGKLTERPRSSHSQAESLKQAYPSKAGKL